MGVWKKRQDEEVRRIQGEKGPVRKMDKITPRHSSAQEVAGRLIHDEDRG